MHIKFNGDFFSYKHWIQGREGSARERGGGAARGDIILRKGARGQETFMNTLSQVLLSREVRTKNQSLQEKVLDILVSLTFIVEFAKKKIF